MTVFFILFFLIINVSCILLKISHVRCYSHFVRYFLYVLCEQKKDRLKVIGGQSVDYYFFIADCPDQPPSSISGAKKLGYGN